MKKTKAIYLCAPLAALFFLGSCADEENVAPTAQRAGITSLTAQFATGAYLDRTVPSYDGTASPTWTIPSDYSTTDLVIPIPYYYPEESDSSMAESMKAMKVSAILENNCFISPSLETVLDLTKKNEFVYTDPYGTQTPITISGELTRSPKCALKSITIQPGDLGGIIDETSKTVSVVTADDLSEATAEVVLDPHATISPDPSVPHDMNDGFTFTVTADNGTSKAEYKVIKQVPAKVDNGYAPGSETDLFNIDMTTIGVTDPGSTHPTLAATGPYVILNLGDGSAPQYFRKATGTRMGTINLGSASANGAITSDNAGNVLICNFATTGQTLNIYKTNDVTKAPELLISYPNNLGVDIGGRLHVQGDVNGNAVITATPYSCNNAIRWIVTNGQVGQPTNYVLNGVPFWGGQDDAAKVCAIDEAGQLGAVVDFYNSGNCQMYYTPDWGTSVYSLLKDTSGSAWGDNQAAIDVRPFNGSRYLLLYNMGYWPQWGLGGDVYLYDASNPSTLTGDIRSASSLKYSWSTGMQGSAAGDGRYADVLLAPSSDGYFMYIFWCSNTHLTFGGAQVDCIAK